MPQDQGPQTEDAPHILVVDDDPDQCALFEAALSRLGCTSETTLSPSEALRRIAGREYAAVLTDLEMAEMSGLELCTRLLATTSRVPVIVVTGYASLDTAVRAIRAGAYDYLIKPVDQDLLRASISRAAQHTRLTSELSRLRLAANERVVASGLMGDSPAARQLVDMISRVSGSDAPVLIRGETGSGKELVARAIHESSSYKGGPFVAINCAALPTSLLESELFGHARGAFTDAKNTREGLFVQASGGTLFLDEIGEMSLEMQAKLLRVLQERKVRPLGSNQEVAFDARILSATHRDLQADVAEGRFRQDLYYRIEVVRIEVPALRERSSDILSLATRFLATAAERAGKRQPQLSPAVAARLLEYDWPGNVRELENCMERVVALCGQAQVELEDLPEKIRTFQPERFMLSVDRVEEILPLCELERRYILRAVAVVRGNRSRAAQMLGLDRRTLYRKLERYAKNAAAHGDSVPRDVSPEGVS